MPDYVKSQKIYANANLMYTLAPGTSAAGTLTPENTKFDQQTPLSILAGGIALRVRGGGEML